MTCQNAIAAECLLLSAWMAPDLLLAVVVDGIFMCGKIVAATEDGIVRLAGTCFSSFLDIWKLSSNHDMQCREGVSPPTAVDHRRTAAIQHPQRCISSGRRSSDAARTSRAGSVGFYC